MGMISNKGYRVKKDKGMQRNTRKNEVIPPKKDYSRKAIDFIVNYLKTCREAFVEELFEDILGEYNNLQLKLERYGENSTFWKRNEKFKYEASSTESKRPSEAWLRSKVKCYEYEAIN